MTKTKVTLHKVSRPRPRGRPRHVWMLRWYCDGKRYGETIGDCKKMAKRDAAALRDDKQSTFKSGQVRADKPEDVTVGELVDLYVADHEFDWMPRTRRSAQVAGKHLADAVGDDMVVSRFNADDVKRVTRHLQSPNGVRKGQARSKVTVKSTLVRISAMFDWATDEGQYFIRQNPFATRTLRKKRKKVKKQRVQVRVYGSTEAEAILDQCPTLWWETFVRMALGSGLRLNEMAHLTWDDLDLAAGKGRVKVTAKRAGSVNVNGQSYPVLEFETKAHVERSVPIGDEVVEALQRLKAKTRGPYVFLTLDRLATIAAKMETGDLRDIFDPINNVLRDFKRIQARAFRTLAGDHTVGTVHDCRRTYCTVMADVVPPHRLKKLAGHADIKTTLGYYIHTDDAYDDQVRSAGLGRPEQDTPRTHLADSAVIEAA